MQNKVEKVRMSKTVFTRRQDDFGEWQKWTERSFNSISQAKKYNGLNSKTTQHRPQD
jgi:hypothetical protein